MSDEMSRTRTGDRTVAKAAIKVSRAYHSERQIIVLEYILSRRFAGDPYGIGIALGRACRVGGLLDIDTISRTTLKVDVRQLGVNTAA